MILHYAPCQEVLEMERNDSLTVERPTGSVKRPLVAFLLASTRIVYLSVRHAKPMRVDYRTGDVWLESESSQ